VTPSPPPPTNPTALTLKERYMDVRERIARAAARGGRRESDIILVAVTKYAEPDQIRELISLGHRDFGENKVQQLVQRAAVIDEWLGRQKSMPGAARALSSQGGAVTASGVAGAGGGVRWHMIGHLQRNKVRKALECARLIHSVDSLRIAEEIQAVANKRDQTVDILLQVNVSGEPSKHGCALPAALPLAEQIETMVQVRLRGLMTMAPLSPNPEDARPHFARLRELFEEMRQAGIGSTGRGAGHFNILSMGMSHDFEVAIEEGANLVRVGTSIFGEPPAGVAEQDDGDDEE